MLGLTTALITYGPVFGPEKFAVSVLLPSAAKVKLAFALTTTPASVQLMNVRPFAGVAFTVTLSPGLKVPPPVTLPPAAGIRSTVIVTGSVAAFSKVKAVSPARFT